MRRGTSIRVARLFWIVLSVCPAQSAFAADVADLIRQGVELRRRNDDAGALRLFEQAYAIDGSPKALAQIGLAEQALGRWLAAHTHLRQALEAKNDTWIQKNRSVLRDSFAQVEGHVGWLEILEGPAGAEVRVDGVARGTLPLGQPLAAATGTVSIELVVPGHYPIHRTTTVRVRETTRESFQSVNLSAAPAQEPSRPPPPPPAPALAHDGQAAPTGQPSPGPVAATQPPVSIEKSALGTRPDRPWPLLITAGGLAGAALIFGVIEHVSWQGKVDAFDAMPTCGASTPGRGGTSCSDSYDSGQRAKVLSFVGYGAAAALAATTAILYVAWPGGDRAIDDGRVACSVNPIAPGLGCALRF